MADEEKKRRFDPSLLGPVGQLLGGIGSGIGNGISMKLGERTLLAAAAIQALAVNFGSPEEATPLDYGGLAKHAVALADAVLAQLEKVPDPRISQAKEGVP